MSLTRLVKIAGISAALLLTAAATNAHAAGGHGYRHYGPHKVSHRHDYYRSYRHHHHRRHRHRHSDRGAYLAGGVILGSIITHALTRPHYQRQTHVTRIRVAESDYRVSRRLFRDRNGNCFERQHNQRGDEIMIELDPAECAW